MSAQDELEKGNANVGVALAELDGVKCIALTVDGEPVFAITRKVAMGLAADLIVQADALAKLEPS